MTPNELYSMKDTEDSFDVNMLKGTYYDFFKELNNEIWYCENQDRIKIKTVIYEREDHRRFWRTVTVWWIAPSGECLSWCAAMQEEKVMIMQRDISLIHLLFMKLLIISETF